MMWGQAERRVLVEHYPLEGAVGCFPHLPNLTLSQIRTKAHALGIRFEGQRRGRRAKWAPDAKIDAAIIAVYTGKVTKGMVRDLAIRLKRPRDWVSERAAQLGLVTPRFKQPDWTEDEDKLLEANATRSPHSIQSIFKKQGFERSQTAIILRRKRKELEIRDPTRFTAGQFAKLLGIDPHWVSDEIRSGALKAEKRGTKRKAQQGGDWYWIKRADARAFVIANVERIDIRKVDKFRFVDLLTVVLDA